MTNLEFPEKTLRDDSPLPASSAHSSANDFRETMTTRVNSVPRFSLVIPAFNEANWLNGLLDTVGVARRHYRGGADLIEVIVADNASTDATAVIALERGCRVTYVEKRAIAAARNGGAAIAVGEIVCFIDADSRIHPDTFNAIDDVMISGKVIVGTSRVHPDRWSFGLWATWLMGLVVSYGMGVDAGVVFCRRADFVEIGGYDENLLYAEDIQLLLDLKKLGRTRGQRFARANGARAITSTRKFDKHGDWHFFTRMPRVAFWMMRDKSRVEKFTRAYWYEDR
jgi:glycosyltransferase involved in cell wall biosynthesis